MTRLNCSEWEAAGHNRKPPAGPEGTRRNPLGEQMSKQGYPRLADVRQEIRLAGPGPVWQAAPRPPSQTHIALGFSSVFKGVEAAEIVLSILPPNKKGSTPKLGWTHI